MYVVLPTSLEGFLHGTVLPMVVLSGEPGKAACHVQGTRLARGAAGSKARKAARIRGGSQRLDSRRRARASTGQDTGTQP